MHNKPAFIIPDRKLKTSHPNYANLRNALRSSEFLFKGHDPVWAGGVMDCWSSKLAYSLRECEPATVFAFGLGGMVALEASTKTPIHNLILCAPGGYYKEYVKQQDYIVKRWIGDARLAEFLQMSVKDLFANMQVDNGLIIVDESEFIGRPAYEKWINDLVDATGWQVIKLPRQRFGVASPGYQKAIVEAVKVFVPEMDL